MWKIWTGSQFIRVISGADPGFFLGGGAPLRNDVIDGEVKILKASTCIRRRKLHLSGGEGVGGGHPLHPPPRSASVFIFQFNILHRSIATDSFVFKIKLSIGIKSLLFLSISTRTIASSFLGMPDHRSLLEYRSTIFRLC